MATPESDASEWRYTNTSAALAGELTTASFYQELLIDNRLGRTIFVMRHAGYVESIPSTNPCGGFNPVLVVKVVDRCIQATSQGGCTRHLGDPSGRTLETYEIKLSQLLSGPVFVPGLGWSMGLQPNAEALKSVNPAYNDKFLDKVMQDLRSDLSSGRSSPVNLYVNLHDPKVTTLHLNLNGQLLGVKVNHFQEQEEICAITIRKDSSDRNESLSTFNIPSRYWEGDKLQCFQVQLNGTDWILGSNREKVQDLIKKKLEEDRSRYTKNELETQILISTREKEDEIARLNRLIDLMKNESDLTKKETSNLKTEIGQNDKEVRKSAAQAEAEAKVKIAELEAETAKIKADAAKIAEENETLRKKIQLEQDRIKDEADMRTSMHKERSERYKHEADNFESFAAILKALAVAIPAIISLYLLFSGKNQSSGIMHMFTNPGSVPPVGLLSSLYDMFGSALSSSSFLPGIVTIAILGASLLGGYGLYKLFRKVFSSSYTPDDTAGRIKEVVEDVKDFVKEKTSNFIDTVKDAAGRIVETVKKVATGVKELAGRVVSGVASCVRGIVHGAKSLFSKVHNGICSWLFG